MLMIANAEPTSWQNETTSATTSTTSSDEGRVTIFAPVTMESQLSLLLPEFSSTPPAPSPVTEITQLSLEVGGSSGASWTTRRGSSGLRPIVQPTAISLDLPVTDDTGSTRTTVITIAPTAHLERSGTTLLVPIETTTRPAQPKAPHVENPGSSLDNPDPATTEPPTTSDASPPPDVTSTAHSENSGVELVLPTEQPQSEDEASQPSNPPQTPASTHAPAPSAIRLGTTSILAGGAPVTLDGATLSLAPSGALLLNGAPVSYDAVAGAGQPEPALDTQALASLATAQASNPAGTGGATSAGTVTETTSVRDPTSATRSTASTAESTGSSSTSAAPAEQTDSGAGARAVAAGAWSATGLVGLLGLVAGVVL